MTLVTRQAMSDDSGVFTDGTAVNKAFIDQIYDQVDDQCHSSTNPTVKPKAVTDEVVAARGSKASLDARLDVSLEEDGTLKSQASLVSASQWQGALGSRNVALNGDLDNWTAGGSAAPDDWTLTTVTIARTGSGMGDTFQFGTGASGFAAKLTRAGSDGTLKQNVIPSAVFTNFANVKGQKFGVSMKAKTSLANSCRIVVDDGVSTTASSFHTGGGTEEHLSAVHTISNTATKLDVYVDITGSDGDSYVGGFNFVFAALAPADWSPLSQPPDASSARGGLVSVGAQTIPGVKTFASPPVGVPTFARCTSALTKNNSTSFSDVTGMAFSVGANEVWAFSFYMFYTSLAAAAYKITLTGPAAPTLIQYAIEVSTLTDATAFGTTVVGTSIDSIDQLRKISGLLRNGANAGTVQLQFAQNVADPSNSVVREDSFVLAWRIS